MTRMTSACAQAIGVIFRPVLEGMLGDLRHLRTVELARRRPGIHRLVSAIIGSPTALIVAGELQTRAAHRTPQLRPEPWHPMNPTVRAGRSGA